MTIDISKQFASDTTNSRQNVVPLVVIYKGVTANDFDEIDLVPDSDKLFLSTTNIFFDGNYYEPLLLNIPDIQESIDHETKKYQISNSDIDISNAPFHGRIFSDNIKDIVNCAIQIFWKSQTCKTLEDCTQIGQGTISRFQQTKKNVRLSVEDLSQIEFQKKDVPELVPDDIAYSRMDRLTAFPMVYGHVDRSPLIKKIDPLLSTESGDESVTAFVPDLEPISQLVTETALQNYPVLVQDKMPEQTSIYIQDGENYINLINKIPSEYADIELFAELLEDPEIDILQGKMFEIVGNTIVATPLFTFFQTKLSVILGIETGAMGRVLRRIDSVKAHRETAHWYNHVDAAWHYISGSCAVIGNCEEMPWPFFSADWQDMILSGTNDDDFDAEQWPSHWWDSIWQPENYIHKNWMQVPFDNDIDDEGGGYGYLEDWGPDIDITHFTFWRFGAQNQDPMLQKSGSRSWNVNKPDGTKSGWIFNTSDYKDILLNDDKRALAWWGRGGDLLLDEGAQVYWEISFRPLSLSSKCVTWWVGQVYMYHNPWQDINYWQGMPEARGPSAAWAGGNYTPTYARYSSDGGRYVEDDQDNTDSNIPAHYFPGFSSIISVDPLMNDIGTREEEWGNDAGLRWNLESGGYGWNHASGYYGDFAKKITDFAIIDGWDSPDKFNSIKIGMPNYANNAGNNLSSDGFITWTYGALNYLHIIQDLFVERVHEKRWFSNVYGRLPDDIQWSPFNSFITEGVPAYVDHEDNNATKDYIREIGYHYDNVNYDGTGGTTGWIVNGGDEFLLQDITDNMENPPDKMFYYTWSNTYYVFEDGEWQGISDYSVITGVAFILFTENPTRIKGNNIWRRNFIRMHRAENLNDFWDEGFDNSEAQDQIGEFYTQYGWDDDLFIQEVNVGGAVDSPHAIIQDLISKLDIEVQYDEQMLHLARAIHQGWRMGFALTKQMPLKEFFEDFATNTKMFPKFRSNGQFTFNPIKSVYNMSDANWKVYGPDVIDFSFQLSKVEDLASSVNVLFRQDYGNRKFDAETTMSVQHQDETVSVDYYSITKKLYPDIDITDTTFIHNTNILYNISQGDTSLQNIFEAKYIRDRYTAEELRKYKLMQSVNQHLVIDMEMSLKFVNLEAGDVMYISQLSDETAFGYKYWGYRAYGGQLVYPFWFVTEVKKGIKSIKVKAYQLHRLQYGFPDWYVDGAINTEGYVPPLSESEIEGTIDDGRVWGSSGGVTTDMTLNFQSQQQDIAVDLSDYFQLYWENDDFDLDQSENDSIKLVIVQQPFGYDNPDGLAWTAEVWDSVEQNWISEFQSQGETNNGFFRIDSVSNPSADYNGFTSITVNDPTYENSVEGKIRIINEYNEEFIKEFRFTPEGGDIIPLGGDINMDGVTNVLDVVLLVQYVLGNEDLTDEQIAAADINNDGGVNILDVVQLVIMILG